MKIRMYFVLFLVFMITAFLYAGGGSEKEITGGITVNNGGMFLMYNGTVSGNNGHDGGVVIIDGTFIMENGSITDNDGSGVVLDDGEFTMKDGVIYGNAASEYGGGVYIKGGTFYKTGGTIYGNDAATDMRNNAGSQGHALYWTGSPIRWRNTTAGPTVTSSSTGFWAND